MQWRLRQHLRPRRREARRRWGRGPKRAQEHPHRGGPQRHHCPGGGGGGGRCLHHLVSSPSPFVHLNTKLDFSLGQSTTQYQHLIINQHVNNYCYCLTFMHMMGHLLPLSLVNKKTTLTLANSKSALTLANSKICTYSGKFKKSALTRVQSALTLKYFYSNLQNFGNL